MKNVNVEDYGVTQISLNESEILSGGMAWLLAVIVGGILYDIISSPEDCVKGFKDGYNS